MTIDINKIVKTFILLLLTSIGSNLAVIPHPFFMLLNPFLFSVVILSLNGNRLVNKLRGYYFIISLTFIIFMLGGLFGMICYKYFKDYGFYISSCICSILVVWVMNHWLKFDNPQSTIILSIVSALVSIYVFDIIEDSLEIFPFVRKGGVLFLLWQVLVGTSMSFGFNRCILA